MCAHLKQNDKVARVNIQMCMRVRYTYVRDVYER